MKSPPLRKYDRSEPTRLKILQAAGALFAARGFHGVGMRDIAAGAGVSLRMANYHFGAKAGLFAVCTRLALDEGIRLPAIFFDPAGLCRPHGGQGRRPGEGRRLFPGVPCARPRGMARGDCLPGHDRGV